MKITPKTCSSSVTFIIPTTRSKSVCSIVEGWVILALDVKPQPRTCASFFKIVVVLSVCKSGGSLTFGQQIFPIGEIRQSAVSVFI